MKEFEREISSLIKLKGAHNNLVSFMGVSYIPQKLICVVTDFCNGGNLFNLLHTQLNVPISWKQRVKFAKDIASGMNYLHTCNPPIIHRDLKSLK